MLAEVEAAFAKWDAFQIRIAARNMPDLKAQARQVSDRKVALENLLLALDTFGGEYSMAAKLRLGDVQYGYGLKLSLIPIPNFLANNATAIQAYQTQLDANAQQFVLTAKQEWANVVASAQASGISNRWSQSALVKLNIAFPNALPTVP